MLSTPTLTPGWSAAAEGFAHESALRGSQEQEVYSVSGGSDQRRRSLLPTESGYYDMMAYRPLVAQVLARAKRPLCELVVADLGCGPGRFTELLLQAGVGRVFALDHNADDLRAVTAGLDETDRKRVVPLHAAVTADPPFGTVDIVLAIEVLCTLPKPGDGYRALRQWLAPGGLAMVSNCCPESYFVHALLNRDWRQAVRIVRDQRFGQVLSGGSIDMHLFDRERGMEEAEKAGFNVLDQHSLSGCTALLLHGLKAGGTEIGPELMADIAAFSGSLPGLARLQVDVLEAR
jgi:SAM-dependent methyltransferase